MARKKSKQPTKPHPPKTRRVKKRANQMTSLGEGVKGLLNPSRACHKRSEVTTRIRGTDMVTDIGATSTFGVNTFRVNPGNSLLFPRLSAPAKVFEKYRVRELAFEFRPTSAATRSGSVVLEFETDVHDNIPTTKEEMLNHQNSARGLPWDAFELRVAGKDLHPRAQMFIRPEAVAPTDYDARLDDLGELHIGASVDSETPVNIGELWVRYDIDLISPSVHSAEPSSQQWAIEASGSFADSESLVSAMAPPASVNNTIEEVLSIKVPAERGGLLLGLGPLEAFVKLFARGNAGSTFSGLPSFSENNGAVLRDFSPSGDFVFNSPGFFTVAENLLSCPGLAFPEAQTVSDISTLPYIGWNLPTLSTGLFLNGLLRLYAAQSSLSAKPLPPSSVMSPLKRSQLTSSWHKHLSTGRFHVSGKDCYATLGTKSYFTGRGCVTSDWVLVKSPKDLPDDGKHHESGPVRCEGACNSVQKFTFK